MDLISATLSLLSVLAVIYGLKEIAQDGAGSIAALSIAAGLAVGVTFVRRQRRLADPLDRSAALPGARFQRGACGQHLRVLRQLRHRRLHRPVPAARARAVTVRGGALDGPYAGAFIVGALLVW